MTRNEGNSGTTVFAFDVSINVLPGVGEPSASVDFTTVNGTATTANNDYLATSGTVLFNSNTPNLQKVNVVVNGDTTFEANETFIVRLSNPVNATLMELEGIGLIFNDDVEPSFAINDVSANEGNAGTTPFVFTITRSGNPTSFSSTILYSTANGTASSASDYTAISNGSVTFAPNETTKTVTVQVTGDTVVEPNETFLVDITNVTNGVIGRATGTGTIVNDDGGITPTPTPTPSVTPTPSPTPTPQPFRPEGDVVDGSGGPLGDNQVLSNDVSYIRQVLLGNLPALANGVQFQAGDTNLDVPGACGNGQIDAGDVTVIRGLNLGLFPLKPVCGPTSPTVTTSAQPENVGRIIRVVNNNSQPGQTVVVAFQLDSQGDEASTSFTVNWNPAVFTYVSSATGTGVPTGTNLGLNTSQTAQGRLGVLLDATNTYAAGTRQILTVTFTVAANASVGVYPFTFTSTPTPQSVSNALGALLTTTYEQGVVTIGQPTAAGVTVSGRILTAGGQGVRGATVVITDQAGIRRSVTTGSFGFYSFDDVEAGQSYVIGVSSKRFRFGSRVVSVADSLADVNFIGQE